MGGDQRAVDKPPRQGHSESGAEPGVRPISESLRRRAVSLTPGQSDALAGLLVPGVRRLVELFSLRNGTLCATLRGGGYAALRIYVTPEGRIVENEEASESDPLGEETEPFVLAREADRLHLGTLLPAEGPKARQDQPARLESAADSGEPET